MITYQSPGTMPIQMPPFSASGSQFEPTTDDAQYNPFTILIPNIVTNNSGQISIRIQLPPNQWAYQKESQFFLEVGVDSLLDPLTAAVDQGPLSFDGTKTGTYDISDAGSFFSQVTNFSAQLNTTTLIPYGPTYAILAGIANHWCCENGYLTETQDDYINHRDAQLGNSGFDSINMMMTRGGYNKNAVGCWRTAGNNVILRIPLSPFLYPFQEQFRFKTAQEVYMLNFTLQTPPGSSVPSINVTRVQEGGTSMAMFNQAPAITTPPLSQFAQTAFASRPIRYSLIRAYVYLQTTTMLPYMAAAPSAANVQMPLKEEFVNQIAYNDPVMNGYTIRPNGAWKDYMSQVIIWPGGDFTKSLIPMNMVTFTWTGPVWGGLDPAKTQNVWTRQVQVPGLYIIFSAFIASQQWGRLAGTDQYRNLLGDFGFYAQCLQERSKRQEMVFNKTNQGKIDTHKGWDTMDLDPSYNTSIAATIGPTSDPIDLTAQGGLTVLKMAQLYHKIMFTQVPGLQLSYNNTVTDLAVVRQTQIQRDAIWAPSFTDVLETTTLPGVNNMTPFAFVDRVMNKLTTAASLGTTSSPPISPGTITAPTSATLNVYWIFPQQTVATYGEGRASTYVALSGYLPKIAPIGT